VASLNEKVFAAALKIWPVISKDRSPDKRITEIAPIPVGVAKAHIVSVVFIGKNFRD
jgi:hypothetical protein